MARDPNAWWKPVEGTYRNHAIGCSDEYEHPGSCRPDFGEPRGSKAAFNLAALLPIKDESEGCDDDELIPLGDIVVTGIELVEWHHFDVEDYDPGADGVTKPWAILFPLKDSGSDGVLAEPAVLSADNIRRAVELYVDSRLKAGMPYDQVAMMVDGVYTDAVVADSILQFALYGCEIYG